MYVHRKPVDDTEHLDVVYMRARLEWDLVQALRHDSPLDWTRLASAIIQFALASE